MGGRLDLRKLANVGFAKLRRLEFKLDIFIRRADDARQKLERLRIAFRVCKRGKMKRLRGDECGAATIVVTVATSEPTTADRTSPGMPSFSHFQDALRYFRQSGMSVCREQDAEGRILRARLDAETPLSDQPT
jgi:hypothetical protein